MPNLFYNIDLGDHTPNECTPKISEDFIGIKINGPNEIVLPGSVVSKTINPNVVIPLCGAYRFSLSYIGKLGSPKEAGRTNGKTHNTRDVGLQFGRCTAQA